MANHRRPRIDIGKAAKSERVKKALHNKAVKVQQYWRSIAPVFEEGNIAKEHRAQPMFGYPGFYRDSVKIEERDGKDEGVFYRVYDDDRKASWIEYGSSHMPEYAPAAKTKAHFKR